ncbi:MAG: YpdA family putative bacillithiol disulfide reductase [Bacteroidota bacterium]
MLDLVIIGAGPIGLACGIAAKQANLEFTILERGTLVNALYHYPTNMTFFSTSEKIEIGGVPFVSHLPRPTRQEALEYYRRVAKKWNLPLRLYEEVQGLKGEFPAYTVASSKGTYQTKGVIIATGFYDLPNMMGVPGEDLPKVKHFYDDPHPYIGQQVLVVGAANSAIDAALETWRKGAEVTLVVRGSEISPRVKYWIRPDIENRIKEGSITAYFESEVEQIDPETVTIRTPEGSKVLPNHFVLAMTGYHPNFEWLGQLGVACSTDEAMIPERDENTFETRRQGVYLAGTVCGGKQTSKWYIENSIWHAERVVKHFAAQLSA